MITKPCIICDKELTDVFSAKGESLKYRKEWETMQPMKGGEINIYFAYGSKLTDELCEKYTGVICDDCAEKLIINKKIEKCIQN